MAGPCVHILTPAPIAAAQERDVRAFITNVASRVEPDDFWIAGRPFFVSLGDLDEDTQELSIDGWHPKGSIGYCAMCNDPTDHVLLAMLAHKTAVMLNGYIDLGDLTIVTSDPSVLTFDGYRPTEDGRYVGPPGFLAYWMGSSEFRLLK